MRAAQEGIVQGDNVSRQKMFKRRQSRRNGIGHCAKMNGNMRCLRNQSSLHIEERTREITPLLDIGRVTTARQHNSHLFRDGS